MLAFTIDYTPLFEFIKPWAELWWVGLCLMAFTFYWTCVASYSVLHKFLGALVVIGFFFGIILMRFYPGDLTTARFAIFMPMALFLVYGGYFNLHIKVVDGELKLIYANLPRWLVWLEPNLNRGMQPVAEPAQLSRTIVFSVVIFGMFVLVATFGLYQSLLTYTLGVQRGNVIGVQQGRQQVLSMVEKTTGQVISASVLSAIGNMGAQMAQSQKTELNGMEKRLNKASDNRAKNINTNVVTNRKVIKAEKPLIIIQPASPTTIHTGIQPSLSPLKVQVVPKQTPRPLRRGGKQFSSDDYGQPFGSDGIEWVILTKTDTTAIK